MGTAVQKEIVMEVKAQKKFWIMKDPNGLMYLNTATTTQKGCWEKFIWPTLIKEAYEKEGWEPVIVYITEDKNK